MKLFVDLDGVACDLCTPLCAAHGQDASVLYGPNSPHLGSYDIQAVLGLSTQEELWAPASAEDFWANLPLTAEAREVVEIVTSFVDNNVENVCILSSPIGFPHTAACLAGKHRWLHKHFPQFSRQFLFGPVKHFAAGSRDHVLIDDHDGNVDAFRTAGGRAFLFPRAWNSHYPWRRDPAHLLDLDLRAMLYMDGMGVQGPSWGLAAA